MMRSLKNLIFWQFSNFRLLELDCKRIHVFNPLQKEELKILGIDFSQRLADVNLENNTLEVK
jgi:hypothetical protein